MTNREKHINNIFNERMAIKIYNENIKKCNYCINNNTQCWVCKTGETHPHYCIEKIELWLKEDAELTADEMFEELGYETEDPEVYTILYTKDEPNKDTRFIRLHKNINGEWEYEKYYDETTSRKPNISLLITKAEHEAICKKLEELKGEANDTL